jgi:hypothetical protein
MGTTTAAPVSVLTAMDASYVNSDPPASCAALAAAIMESRSSTDSILAVGMDDAHEQKRKPMAVAAMERIRFMDDDGFLFLGGQVVSLCHTGRVSLTVLLPRSLSVVRTTSTLTLLVWPGSPSRRWCRKAGVGGVELMDAVGFWIGFERTIPV